MSKISYCSLEEAWGSSYKLNNNENNGLNNVDLDNNNSNSKNNDKLYSLNTDDKYSLLHKKSEEDRDNVINNMNNIERNNSKTENRIIEYNKYRLNSNNVVKESPVKEESYALQKYMPFSESIERKYLEDKLKFLENEILKYKNLIDNNDGINSDLGGNFIESFSNNNNSSNVNQSSSVTGNVKNNDLIDIILLIIIGLIIILVMNSIFNIGKAIGMKRR
jgi:hypothetical protein